MVVPNTQLISEIILYSNGFREARGLAIKISRLFDYLNEQLKFCAHYDFGLRTIKTILIAAGKMKLRSICVKSAEQIAMENAEKQLHEYLGEQGKKAFDRKIIEQNRGTFDFHRQKLLKKMKEKDVVKLVDEKNEEAFNLRVNYTKLKETFVD